LQPLGRYIDREGRTREVIASRCRDGSVLVLDRDAATQGDRLVVAHLASDEPFENAAVVTSRYLEDGPADAPPPRRLTLEDLETAGPGEGVAEEPACSPQAWHPPTVHTHGCSYRLAPCWGCLSIPELRWARRADGSPDGPTEIVSLREAVADLESYEPLCWMTATALGAHAGSGEVSTTALRLELTRVRESPIVLNRRLRETVLAAIGREGLSMSEIATRCGRIKRDSKGNESGETSWLARRLGLLPEGGQGAPTPWIHTDVLGLIARRGLGISPREVEL